MKLVVTLLISLAAGAFSVKAEYSKKRVEEVLKVGNQCKQELSIPEEDNVIERALTRNDMRYMLCFYSKFNMLDANDNIVVDKVVNFMVEQYAEQVIRPVVTRCAKQGDPSVYDRLWKFYQCISTDKSW
ncbi:predicted protein [Culex quinquefasciatus]|uniref:Predicted protein n=1 Tax=Culex quinquefasciatus TaxID=7176 RepID=B0W4L1_CULQU|nr:predicted protein [Culex quinquefasciatus]|eukprot:XP_001843645.1 predicted protein [Culex quinquefasciatus]